MTAARELAKLTQTQLSQKVGFKDRQTLAAIEAGQRQVAVKELMALIKATGKDLDFFTDPFRIVGEGGFSYRAGGTSEIELDQFEEQAGQWLALWRFLGDRRGDASELAGRHCGWKPQPLWKSLPGSSFRRKCRCSANQTTAENLLLRVPSASVRNFLRSSR